MPGKLISPYDNSPHSLASSLASNLLIIAQYKALISLSVHVSALEIFRVIDQPSLERALDERPEYVSGEWPQRHSYERVEDDLSALRKLKALLDFGIDGPMGSAEEVAKFHAVAFADTIRQAEPSIRYKLYAVHAEIWSNGSASWGYESPIVGADLPGLNTDADLDEYLQSSARVDIRQKLEALRKPQ